MRSIRLLLTLQLVQLRSAMAYRADFWIGIVGAILQQCVSVVFLVTFFSQVGSLGGWTIAQVAILQGLVMISSGLVELFGDGIWQLRAAVSTGTFDRVLVRPLSPAIQQMGSLASIHGLGNAGMGVALLCVALPRAGADFEWWTIPVLLLTFLCGFVHNLAINFLTNMTVFLEPSAQSAFPTMVALVRDFAKFPLDIYPQVLRWVITFVLPYATITYLPTSLLLGRGHWWWIFGPVLAAGGMAIVASAVWRRALNFYQGVGH